MASIANLTVKDDGTLEGNLATLMVTAPIAIVPNGRKVKDSEPVINTSRRTYHIELRATPATYMAGVSWPYPQDALIALRAAETERDRIASVAGVIDYAALYFAFRLSGEAGQSTRLNTSHYCAPHIPSCVLTHHHLNI